MRAVFMGTPEFALPSLHALNKNYKVEAVVTQPDKPRGRGKKISFSPIKEYAIENNLIVLQPEKIRNKDFINCIRDIAPDVIVVAAYGKMLPDAILKIPKYGCINVHGSLLPKYRGAAPIQWAVINGETKTGITIMLMDKGIDTGDIILSREIAINKNDDFGAVYDKLALLGAEALTEALKMPECGISEKIKQDDSISTYAPLITKEMEKINWNKSADEIINLIRGLSPYPGAYTGCNGKILKIYSGEALNEDGFSTAAPGEIIKLIDKGFVIKTGYGALAATEVQPQGGKKMPARDYMRGHKIESGIILD